MTPKLRFAPSPTGRLHIGNVRTAVLNYLFALKHKGHFMLRLDDTDRERSTEAFAEGIREDLRWLGLGWDSAARQSERTARYEAAAELLKASGRLYPCYETTDELELRRKRQLGSGRPPIYDRQGLKLTSEERSRLEADGRRPHWRFRLDNTAARDSYLPEPTEVAWDDLVRGRQVVDAGSLSDPVLVREDGTFLYTFTSVVDDAEFGITHIIRGEDHVTNTGVQIQIFEALGTQPPIFAHHSLLVGADGQALSKRLGALSVESLRAEGLEPMAVVSHAALIGSPEAIEPYKDMSALAERLDVSRLSTAPARFDPKELAGLNAKLLHMLDFEDVAEKLGALGVPQRREFWEAVRGNLTVLADAQLWWSIVSEDIAPVVEDAAFLKAAAALLPPEPWDETTWGNWTDAVKRATGCKGRALFHPLRLALTGRDSGPELKALLPFIGRSRAEARLVGRAA